MTQKTQTIRSLQAVEVWKSIPKASQGTAWTPADLTYDRLLAADRLLDARNFQRLMLWFWIKGIAADATADIQIAGWPVFGDVNAPIVPGNQGSVAKPHGWIVVDGTITFDYHSPIPKNPITGADEIWYPGHYWTSSSEYVVPLYAVISGGTQTPATGKAQPMIMELSDLKNIGYMDIQADVLPTNSTLLVIAACA